MPIWAEYLIVSFLFAINTIAFAFWELLICFNDSFYIMFIISVHHIHYSDCFLLFLGLYSFFLILDHHGGLCYSVCLIFIRVLICYCFVSELAIGLLHFGFHLVFGIIRMSLVVSVLMSSAIEFDVVHLVRLSVCPASSTHLILYLLVIC